MKYVLALIYNFFPAFPAVFLTLHAIKNAIYSRKNGKKFPVLFADPLNFQFTKDLEVNCSSHTFYAAIVHWFISHPVLNMIRILLILHMHLIISSVKI